MTTKHTILKDVFGHETFREGQEQLIDAVLSGRDVLGVMPTGAGKSVCYQVPALLMPGVTLVVSPLISLMKDQTQALKMSGVPAAYLNSSLSDRQFALALERAAAGAYKLIYVAPERLNTSSFLGLCGKLDISLLAVDEAHCVSQWGQDFRPSYREIPRFLDALLSRPPVAAFTATATPRVREDVVEILGLKDPLVRVTGFDRANLYLEVRRPKRKLDELIAILTSRKERSGIVYCSTRKAVEEVACALCAQGFSAARYHAGLSDEERHTSQEDFLYDRVSVMVATNAFGMGIDKSNVSFVVHYNMPKDLESYYQEAGRAGRDGSDACCILLYGGQDLATARFLIEHKDPDMYPSPEAEAFLKEQERRRLRVMEGYCKTNGCLRAYILAYFGEQRPERCGHCGNCDSETEQTDVTETAKAVLRCVADCRERYGRTTVVEVLRGSRAEKVLRFRLDKLALYGTCRQSSAALNEIVDLLLAEGYLEQTEGAYPVLKKGARFDEGVSQEARILIRRMRHKEEAAPASARFADPGSQALFGRLKALRAQLASEAGVPAYVVFHDSTLLQMSAARPADETALLRVPGVGRAKAERYGATFLQCIADFVSENQETAAEGDGSGQGAETAAVSARLETQEQPVTVSQIADRLSVLSLQNGGKKISAKKVNDYLTEKGLLETIDAPGGRRRAVTDRGRALGIFSERRLIQRMPYEAILFGLEAQEYIADRAEELLRFCART